MVSGGPGLQLVPLPDFSEVTSLSSLHMHMQCLLLAAPFGIPVVSLCISGGPSTWLKTRCGAGLRPWLG